MHDIIVTPAIFDDVVALLRQPGTRAVDTETTGLDLHGDDRLFAIIIHDGNRGYYFDFLRNLNLAQCVPGLRMIFTQMDSKWFAHNAKFDMRAIEKEGIFIYGDVHCTEVFARLLDNSELSYTLDACAKRIGYAKSKAVEEYIKKHKLWEWEIVPGKKVRRKKKFFDKVPFDVMLQYALKDAEICYELGKKQEAWMLEDEKTCRSIFDVPRLHREELKFTRVLYAMENMGAKVDLNYVQEGAEFLQKEIDAILLEISRVIGEPFVDSNKSLERYFNSVGITGGLTELGNPTFKEEILEDIDHPLAKIILKYRNKNKLLTTYYLAILELHKNGAIHTEFRQGGTITSRLSSANPNMQNLPKEDTSVRKAFIPRDGFVLVSIDYSQLEYRVMLDKAEEMPLIEKIKAGMDVHDATAQMMGVDRKKAKTLNFAILYGTGVEKLGHMLGVSMNESLRIRNQYFSALPKVERFIHRVIEKAKYGKMVQNWAGRKYLFPMSSFAYKAPNYLIQGGCADIVRRAMNEIHDYLLCKKSRMLLQVHDELVFEIHESELAIIPILRNIMEKAYPHKHLPLECKVMWSRKSWGDLEEYGEETGNNIQGAGVVLSEQAS